MSKYTIELDRLLKSDFDLGMKDYPIFDEKYRTSLNSKILEHFRFREIGFETPSRFKYFLNRTMNEIMPLFNQYYNSAKLQFEPLYNVDITNRESNSNNIDSSSRSSSSSQLSGTGESTLGSQTTNTSSHWDKFSDTPQGKVDLIDIDEGAYLTNARKIGENSTDTTTGTNSSSNSENGSSSNSTSANTDISETKNKTQQGRNGESGSELLLKYRSTFLNIDMMVIAELGSLFMNIY